MLANSIGPLPHINKFWEQLSLQRGASDSQEHQRGNGRFRAVAPITAVHPIRPRKSRSRSDWPTGRTAADGKKCQQGAFGSAHYDGADLRFT